MPLIIRVSRVGLSFRLEKKKEPSFSVSERNALARLTFCYEF